METDIIAAPVFRLIDYTQLNYASVNKIDIFPFPCRSMLGLVHFIKMACG